MTPTAPLHSLRQCHRLPMKRGHGLHGRPGLGVFACLELFGLGLVTLGARVRRRELCLREVFYGGVF